MRAEEYFASFLGRNLVDEGTSHALEQAWGRLRDHLLERLELSQDDVFMHGSYVNRLYTTPEQEDAEHDLDAVVVCGRPKETVFEVYDILERAVLDSDEHGERLEPRGLCLRVHCEHGPVRVHFDLVPARPSSRPPAVEVALTRWGWRPSNPAGFTQWCLSQGEGYRRVAILLKKWRDRASAGTAGINSLPFQVILADVIPASADSDAEAVTEALHALSAILERHPDHPPAIPNPALPGEDLSLGWPPDAYQRCRREVAAAAELARRALDERDLDESVRLWSELFGPRFAASA